MDHARLRVARLSRHAEECASAREIARNAASLKIPEGEFDQAIGVAARFKKGNAFDNPASLCGEPCILHYAHL
jgi:hypothetical protein